MSAKLIKLALAVGLLLASDVVNHELGGIVLPVSFISDAHAVIGRPWTPASVAGVARRTTRRVVRRSTIYVSTLPASCAAVTINGAGYWRCGGTYYQAYGGRYVVVYVN